jgi:dihydrolipoamide dehydrogenase
MTYDVTVIGSGPGGYIAAIRAAQLGMNVAIIERYSTLGGTCLNVGCIPSKALLDSSEHYHNAVHKFSTHGIDLASPPSVNMAQMMKRKSEVVGDTTKGIAFLMKKNKITVFEGHGSFVSANKIAIKKPDGSIEEIETAKTIIATGSKPIVPAMFNYDKKRVITSTEALTLTEVPKTMVIVGGGVIGLELGSVYARLGCKVSVIEFADRIIATMDSDCSKELMKSLKGIGIEFYLKHGVTNVVPSENSVKVEYKKRDTEDVLSIEADYCLVAIGRRPYTDNLGLENAGVVKDERGRIAVDGHLQTNIAGIYAIGDVIQGAMLAHTSITI